MRKTVIAALVYFGLVLGTGFVLGMIRVPFIVPTIGERWAELAEMPIMATVIFISSGYILNRFPEIQTSTRSLIAGFLALALSVCAELGLAVALQSETLVEYIASRYETGQHRKARRYIYHEARTVLPRHAFNDVLG